MAPDVLILHSQTTGHRNQDSEGNGVVARHSHHSSFLMQIVSFVFQHIGSILAFFFKLDMLHDGRN